MTTDCYAMVRAATLRVTALTPYGSVTTPIRAASTDSVTTIVLDEVNDEGSPELLTNDIGEPRVLLDDVAETLGFSCGISFLRTDPAVIELLTGHPVVKNKSGDVVGFRADTKLPAAAFALEVWSNLTGRPDQWGYTVFPFLKGGMLAGFRIDGGAVTFTVSGARTIKHPRWSVGPFDLTGWHERLLEPVSGNTAWHNQVTTAPPPARTDGVQTYLDVISNGNAANPHPLRAGTLSGGNADSAGPWIVSGGGA